VLCCAVLCCAVLPLQLKKLHKLDMSQLQFVGESLTALRKEVGNTAAVLGKADLDTTAALGGAGSTLLRLTSISCSHCSVLRSRLYTA
jgi:hypothetical protein